MKEWECYIVVLRVELCPVLKRIVGLISVSEKSLDTLKTAFNDSINVFRGCVDLCVHVLTNLRRV